MRTIGRSGIKYIAEQNPDVASYLQKAIACLVLTSREELPSVPTYATVAIRFSSANNDSDPVLYCGVDARGNYSVASPVKWKSFGTVSAASVAMVSRPAGGLGNFTALPATIAVARGTYEDRRKCQPYDGMIYFAYDTETICVYHHAKWHEFISAESTSFVPIGGCLRWPGTTPPDGFAFCNGSKLPAYSVPEALVNVLGEANGEVTLPTEDKTIIRIR